MVNSTLNSAFTHVRVSTSERTTETKVIPVSRAYSLPFTEAGNQLAVSVVIPAMNEAQNLPYVLPQIPSWVHEVILVDGHSTDDTVEVARQLLPGINIVSQKGRGKGAALRTGFAAAKGDIIVMLDADGSMDAGEIPAYVGALVSGADFAKGSRFLQGGGTHDMSWLRFAGNWCLTLLVRLIFGGYYSDLCYGYNAFWKSVLPILALDANGFEIETLMNVRALRAHLKVTEVPSFEALRLHGESNLNTFRDGWRVLKTIVREHIKMVKGEALTEWKRDQENKATLRRHTLDVQRSNYRPAALQASD